MGLSKTFKFSDECGNWCDVYVSLLCDSIDTPGSTYYSIYYRYSYSTPSAEAYSCNPLFYLNKVARIDEWRSFCKVTVHAPHEHIGSTIKQNVLSDMLVRYLMMDFKSLENLCGDVSPQKYKANVMGSIYAIHEW